MSELGKRLRRAREEQGISLAQAAVETRILQLSLVALEEGAFDRLPGDVVVRGFIRNYAQYLSLPPEEMIELYRLERGSTDRILVRPVTMQVRPRSYTLPSFFGVFFVTIMLVGLSYVGLSAVGRIGDRTTTMAQLPSPSVVPPTPLPTETFPTVTDVPQRPSAIAGGVARPSAPSLRPTVSVSNTTTETTVTAIPTPNSNAPIVLEISIDTANGGASSWIRVQADGSTVYEGTMRAGEKQIFEARRRVVVRAGNPTDVLIAVNGLQQGRMGQIPGRPVNWSWPPN